jgi:hypothetical protein
MMTKEEFKRRWESDDEGGGITFNDIADCYTAWGMGGSPRTKRIDHVRYAVLTAAGIVDVEEYQP